MTIQKSNWNWKIMYFQFQMIPLFLPVWGVFLQLIVQKLINFMFCRFKALSLALLIFVAFAATFTVAANVEFNLPCKQITRRAHIFQLFKTVMSYFCSYYILIFQVVLMDWGSLWCLVMNEIPSNMSRIVLIQGRRTCWCQEGQLLPPLISMVNKQNIALQRPGRPSITTAPLYFETFHQCGPAICGVQLWRGRQQHNELLDEVSSNFT